MVLLFLIFPLRKRRIKTLCDQYNISFIPMVTLTSKNRIPMIVEEAEGFIYCVSSMGVTGIRNEISSEILEVIQDIKR